MNFEALAWDGWGLLEGPRCDPQGRVYFSDVLGGGVRRWTPGGSGGSGSVEDVVPKRRGVGGIALHADGGVVVSGRDLAHVGSDGETRVLLTPHPGVMGFNDFIPADDGSVLVGAMRFRPFAGEPPVAGEVWRVPADGTEPEELFGPVGWPNGMGLSPDGETVYIADYSAHEILAWRAGESMTPVSWAAMPDGADCDGLAVDAEGGVWVALGAAGAIGRFDPDGGFAERFEVPSSFVSSVAFGGSDMRDLYVTTADNTAHPKRGGTLWRGRAEVPGRPVAVVRA
jgi:sugar lactone lactonase YvrE